MHTLPTLDTGFIDTSADQLRFSLDHERITPLASEFIELPGTDNGTDSSFLELHVIGSSHQVILAEAAPNETGPNGTESVATEPNRTQPNGTKTFIETFACLGEDPGQRPEWNQLTVTHGTWSGFTRHEFRPSRHDVPVDFAGAVAEVLRRTHEHERHLVVGFPGDPNAITALALTAATPERLEWETWHCYPQHRQLVHSASALSRDDAATTGGRDR